MADTFTLDLHLDNQYKADEYDMWAKRIYTVSSTLHISMDIVWNMNEHEFLVFEQMARDEIDKARKKQEALKAKQN